MKVVIAVLILVGILGCEREQTAQEKAESFVQTKLLDSLTVIVSKHEMWDFESIETYAIEHHPRYKVVSVRFLGIANDPDCYYEVKMALSGGNP